MIEKDENSERVKFLCSIDQGKQNEILSYNEVLDTIERQHEAEYNNLLGEPGWERSKPLATWENRFKRMIRRSRLKSVRHVLVPIYQYRVKAPRNYKEAIELDVQNGSTKWKDSTDLNSCSFMSTMCSRIREGGSIYPTAPLQSDYILYFV
jgi:hypothetical protein